MRLTTSRSKVKIKRFGAIGYTIEFGTKTFNGLLGSETKSYVLDSEGASLYQSGSSEIQLWEKNIFRWRVLINAGYLLTWKAINT